MEQWLNRVHFGDCLETLRRMPDGLVQTCVTSPPYFGLRDYGHPGQIGLEASPEEFVQRLVEVFREVRRVLRDDGTAWVNMGDSYSQGGNGGGAQDSKQQTNVGALLPPKRTPGFGPKQLLGIPWRLAFALQADGWILRQDIVWAKPNPMPESVRDRCTKAHEYIFLLSKSERYYFDQGAIAEPAQMWFGRSATFDRGGNAVAEHIIPGQSAAQHRPRVNEGARKALRTDTESRHRSSIPGGQSLQSEPDGTRNRRSVWTVATKPYSGAHFATFPPELIEPCILAGAPAGGVVLDPFFGSGTTGEVSQRLGRQWIGCELNTDYKPLQDERLRQPGLVLEEAA
jgi:DNA modification methylase